MIGKERQAKRDACLLVSLLQIDVGVQAVRFCATLLIIYTKLGASD